MQAVRRRRFLEVSSKRDQWSLTYCMRHMSEQTNYVQAFKPGLMGVNYGNAAR